MQIHQLNDYNGNVDAGYLAIDNGSDTGKITPGRLTAGVKQEIDDVDSSLNARIDNIIAGGTAPSEAEVTDARQGATDLGGVTYASLGDAIRGQASYLMENIEALGVSGDFPSLQVADFVNGTWGNGPTLSTGDNRRLACKKLIPVKAGDVLVIKNNTTGLYYSYGFFKDGETTVSGYSNWITNENTEHYIDVDGTIFVQLATGANWGSSTMIVPSDYDFNIMINRSDKTAHDIGNVLFGSLSDFAYRGKSALIATEFFNEYVSASSVVSDTLYLCFICDTKLLKGTKISVKCPTHYCAVALYDKNNWNSSNRSVIQSAGYAQEYEFVLQFDGYPVLTIATDPVYSSRVPISRSDYNEDIVITPATEFESDMIYGNRLQPFTYLGEPIDVGVHRLNARKVFSMTHNTTDSVQGGACYGNYFFQFENQFKSCAIYDMRTNELVQLITLTSVATWHCNNANFGNEFYDNGDDFPLLYISMEDYTEHNVIVFRVTGTEGAWSLTQVQTITWDGIGDGGLSRPNAVINNDNNTIIQQGVTTPGDDYIDFVFNVFHLPALAEGDVNLHDSDKIDTFTLRSPNYPQGAFCANNRIVQAFGLYSNHWIQVLDLSAKKYVTFIDLDSTGISSVANGEQEAVFLYNGRIHCSNVSKEVWEIIV